MQVLDLQERKLLQRRCVPADPRAHLTCFTFGSMAALPDGRVAVASGEVPEVGASISVFEMGMAGGELARTGAWGRAMQAPRTVLHTQARHAEQCVPPCMCAVSA